MIKSVRSFLINHKLFRLAFLLISFVYIFPYTILIGQSLAKILLLWGALILFFDLANKQSLFQSRKQWLIYGFVLFAMVSQIINFSVRNIVDFLYLFAEVVLITLIDRRRSEKDVFNEIFQFGSLIVFLTFLVSLASWIVFLVDYKGSINVNESEYLFGVFEGRLWGILGNPNSGALCAAISIILSLYLIVMLRRGIFFRSEKGWQLFLSLNIVLQFVVMSLGSSRSTLVSLVVMVFFSTYWLLSHKFFMKVRIVPYKIIATALVSLFVATCVPLLAQFSNSLVGYFPPIVNFAKLEFFSPQPTATDTVNHIGDNIEKEPATSNNYENSQLETPVVVNRNYLEQDLTNGRTTIWRAGIKVFLENPLLGIGNEEMINEVNQFLPSEFVEQHPQIGNNMHNIFLQVLVSYGGIAFIFFVVYLFAVLVPGLKRVIVYPENSMRGASLAFSFSLLCGLLVENLFDSNILYFMSFLIVPIFWSFLGYYMYLKEAYKPQESKKKRVLFFINSLEGGGAEKVLITLVNRLVSKFDITVKTVYDAGIYRGMLAKDVKYETIVKNPTKAKRRVAFRLLKALPAVLLHTICINGDYDVEVGFLEGICCKVISGGQAPRRIGWVHVDIQGIPLNKKEFISKSSERKCYNSLDTVVCVSEAVKNSLHYLNLDREPIVIYNPIDTLEIRQKATLQDDFVEKSMFTICSVGRLTEQKGYDRLIESLHNIFLDGLQFQMWIIGAGEEEANLRQQIDRLGLQDMVFLLGYKENIYSILKRCDLFVCSSRYEGYSLVVAEALVLSVPVISVECAGPVELLNHGEYGMIIENSTESLYRGIKAILTDSVLYRELKNKAKLGSGQFNIENILQKVANILD